MWRLHTGADYAVKKNVGGVAVDVDGDRRPATMEDTGASEAHPMHSIDPAFTNTNAFSGARHWTLMLAVRRAIGG